MRTQVLRALLLALILSLLTFGAPAHAADEVVRNLDVTYDVRADGTIDVRHELDWDFGEAGRHGIIFDLIIAEVWDADPTKLVTYGIEDLRVSSPTGAPSQFIPATFSDQEGGRWTEVRIGDPDRPLPTSRETYVITYSMTGGLRTFDGVPELHLDVTSAEYPRIESFTVTVTAEAGVVPRARCLVGSRECDADTTDGTATLGGGDVASGDILTAVAELPANQRGATPTLVNRPAAPAPAPSGSWWMPVLAVVLVAAAVGLAVAAPRMGRAVGRLRIGHHDRHYSDAPPGERGREVSDVPFRGQVPVRLMPPETDVTTAGFVLDRGFNPRHTAATLVQMAVSGAIRLGANPLAVGQLDPDRATSSVEHALYKRGTPSVSAALGTRRMQQMNSAVESGFSERVRHFLFLKESRKTLATHLVHVAAGLVLPGLTVWLFLADLLILAVPVFVAAVLFIVGLVAEAMQPTFSLNADGTALRQQVLGFRTYITLAEARQLDFEAEQDIYRRYLPWAVLFGRTRRWTKVCRELAAAGRIELDTSFMSGAASVDDVSRSLRRMDKRLRVSTTPDRAMSRSAGSSGGGTGGFGSGGSSGFGGGARGGSGGGGSGARSW